MSGFLEETISDLERDLAKVYEAIAKTSQLVSKQMPFRVGMTRRLNPFGETQAELDVFANDAFAKSLLDTGRVGWVASEELEVPLGGFVQSEDALAVAMDPLDGSSNIVTNNPLGSIFGIWRGALPKKGRDLIAAAFVTYGPTLTITLSVSDKVNQYVEIRDGENSGRFVLAYRGMKIPAKPEVYGFGGTRSDWIPAVEEFVSGLEARGMRLRYGGTFIGDYNQVLQRGGIFSYPAHKKSPDGKLRICYETAPVSYLTELAGGSSSDGYGSILDIQPKKLTQTSAFYIGNSGLIRELEAKIGSESRQIA
ncbi:MAG: class 1 fructose-bisphosphatase [Nitrososphaerales archaeon]